MDAALPDARPRSTPPALAIVIVNFDSWADTDRLVGSLAGELESLDGRCEVVVVDNASADPPPAGLESRPGIRVVLRPDNGGFAAGVNTGWRSTPARWLLLLNPDVVAGPGLIGRVLGRIEALEAGPGVGPVPGVVGFGLRNEDGSRQHSVGAFPTLLGCVRESFRPRSRRKYWPLSRTGPGPVPWVTGACMLVRSAVLEQLGGMDEEFFLYHEEVALCRSARDAGWGISLDVGVEVAHLRPLQSREVSPRLRVVTRHSKLLYFLKHRPRWEFEVLARVVSAEAWIRGLSAGIGGRAAEAGAWAAVGRIAREMGPGRGPRGVRVREIADRAVSGGGVAPGRGPYSGRREVRAEGRSIPLDVSGRSR
ncbi:glycosyltransferase family 2 protein [Tautonia plasticadhaerens]|uniref:N-acetylglucosaminyl-diphospho-decaprenol L-rhamnosyltransferase n=1 Tax=Tautonia plasticadhaerens TaxID=2527974 RepID=A0A518H7A6_9BACT|nr:glycosyltransferase family 2 protein [Tautonia plasticadhaerens]QDV36748.1 N-acetylglucosaminyl-diphospho-decaprenol L-rhamnosyltransferase [Tautonia plasticadhaerens]